MDIAADADQIFGVQYTDRQNPDGQDKKAGSG